MTTPATRIRQAVPADAAVCGRICYEAFATINRQHNFPPDIPSADVAIGLLTMLFSHPGMYCVVAESENGQLLGSNCMDEREAIGGIGPITVDPAAQNRSVGRLLMEAVMARAKERGLAGTRLLQAAFHNRSLSLYSKLGFDAREPVSVMQGPRIGQGIDGFRVRPGRDEDTEAACRVSEMVHGMRRTSEWKDAVEKGTAMVVERRGRITGYATIIGFFGHAVGIANDDVKALIGAADTFHGPGVIVPTRNSEVFRWCLEHGLRVMYPMTLMSTGLYNEPAGAFLPSILY